MSHRCTLHGKDRQYQTDKPPEFHRPVTNERQPDCTPHFGAAEGDGCHRFSVATGRWLNRFIRHYFFSSQFSRYRAHLRANPVPESNSHPVFSFLGGVHMSATVIPFRAASSELQRSSPTSPLTASGSAAEIRPEHWRSEVGTPGLGLLSLRRYRVNPMAALVWLVGVPSICIGGWILFAKIALLLWKLA